jgi:nitrous oxidase accessory protein NosD
VGIELFNFPITVDQTIGTGNKVYQNNIINNSKQAYIQTAWIYASNFPNYTWTNGTDIVAWDNGKEGNYWSDYQSRYPSAKEFDSSGIGNTPYVIDQNNTDYHPLIRPVDISTASPSPSIPEFPWLILFPLLVATTLFAIFAHEGKRL